VFRYSRLLFFPHQISLMTILILSLKVHTKCWIFSQFSQHNWLFLLGTCRGEVPGHEDVWNRGGKPPRAVQFGTRRRWIVSVTVLSLSWIEIVPIVTCRGCVNARGSSGVVKKRKITSQPGIRQVSMTDTF